MAIPKDIHMGIVQKIGQIVLHLVELADANIAEAQADMNMQKMDVVEYVKEPANVQVAMVKEVTIIKTAENIKVKNNYRIKMRKQIGQVTGSERDEIQSLFERKNGLNELAKILTADNSELYERLVKDLSETSSKFQNWWDNTSKKYQWESTENGNWEIDFNDCSIYLVTTE